MIKLRRGLILLGLLLGIFMPVVSAQSDPIFQSFKNAFSSMLGFFFGEVNSGELLFVKFLVFLLILVMVKYALNRIPAFEGKRSLIAIISIIVSLLAVRYMTSDALVNMIWLPYGALGIVLSSILPLIIFFYFIESIDSSIIRKVGWVAFVVIYTALAILRWSVLIIREPGILQGYSLAWLYLIIAAISLLMIIFDKQVRMKMVLGAIRRGEDTHSLVLKTELQEELRKINNTLAYPGLSAKDESRLKEEKKRIERAIARIS